MKNLLVACLMMVSLISCQKESNVQPMENVQNSSKSIFNNTSKWETADGDKLKLADLQGNVLVMAMVYTSCKTSCPRLAFDMKEIDKQVGDSENVKYVFISIDPSTDSPKKMKEFLRNYKLEGKQWVFLRSSEDNTRELANMLSVRYKELSPMELSHSNLISIFSKDGIMEYQKKGLNTDLDQTVKEIEKQL